MPNDAECQGRVVSSQSLRYKQCLMMLSDLWSLICLAATGCQCISDSYSSWEGQKGFL